MALNDFEPYVHISGLVTPLKCLYSRMINGFYVPCGKCEYCRRSTANSWGFRLHEHGFDKFCYNCLLTYDDDSLVFHKGSPTVSKIHCQEFLKRFRYYVDKYFGAKLTYFLVAEYGGKRGRPHYHMLLFSDKNLKVHETNILPFEFINDIIQTSWKHGYADVDDLRDAGQSSHYLTSYMINYHDGKEYDEFNRPFRLMSRCGLGKSWIDRHPNHVKKMIAEQNYTTKINGYTVAIPRYLRRKIMPEEQQIARADAFYEYSKNFENNFNNYNYEQRNKHFENLKFEREQQLQREKEDYRKRKIHRNNSNRSKLSRRIVKSKIE